jgi:hypothetical protein
MNSDGSRTRANDMVRNAEQNAMRVPAQLAVTLAKQGVAVMAGATNPNENLPGHVGVVFPADASTRGPNIGQAGVRNGVFTAEGSGFPGGVGNIEYFIDADPPSPREVTRRAAGEWGAY